MPTVLGWTPVHQEGDHVQLGQEYDTDLPTTPEDASSPERSPSPFDDDDPPVNIEDPDHIPRPRNSFIIFRCEFTRRVAGTVKGKRGDGKKDTISKRAGEVWRQMSASEKARFQEMAEREKEQHQREHPTYKFKPLRRRNSNRKPRRPRKSNNDGPTLRRTSLSQRKTAPSISSDSPGPSTTPTPTPHLDNVLYQDVPKPAHLRSISAPRPMNSGAPRPAEVKRSRSAADAWMPLPNHWPYDAVTYLTMGNPESFMPPNYVVTPPSPSTNLNFPAFKVSPFAAVASSLAGWNGDNPPPSLPQTPSSSQSWSSFSYTQPEIQDSFFNCDMNSAATSNFIQTTGNGWDIDPSINSQRLLYNLPNEPFDNALQQFEYGNGMSNSGDPSFQHTSLPSDEELFEQFLV